MKIQRCTIGIVVSRFRLPGGDLAAGRGTSPVTTNQRAQRFAAAVFAFFASLNDSGLHPAGGTCFCRPHDEN